MIYDSQTLTMHSSLPFRVHVRGEISELIIKSGKLNLSAYLSESKVKECSVLPLPKDRNQHPTHTRQDTFFNRKSVELPV